MLMVKLFLTLVHAMHLFIYQLPARKPSDDECDPYAAQCCLPTER